MTTTPLRRIGKFVLRPQYRREQLALRQLRKTPRYQTGSTNILGFPLAFTDALSFLNTYKDIFEQQVYRFKPSTPEPLIIDCGANIGLSALYFKRVCPKARVIAFEPDPKIFKTLEANVTNAGLNSVKLINKALWTSETTLEFMAEGGSGGRLVNVNDSFNKTIVHTTRLRDFLTEKVELLKIDIEGAELPVLQDCADRLDCVRLLFVEYHSFVKEPQKLHELLSLLNKAGFRVFCDATRKVPQPFYHVGPMHGMDLLLNIYAYRE